MIDWLRKKLGLDEPVGPVTMPCDRCGKVCDMHDMYADPPFGPFWCPACARDLR